MSKTFDITPESLYLRPQGFYDAINVRVLLNKRANDVNIGDQVVTFDDGDEIYYDKLLIASGKVNQMYILNICHKTCSSTYNNLRFSCLIL